MSEENKKLNMSSRKERSEEESSSRKELREYPGTNLSPTAKQEINNWLKKFPNNQKQSVVIHALQFLQDENGGVLTTALMNEVANHLDIPPIKVYEVATFYKMFDLDNDEKAKGAHRIAVCTNISCSLCDCGKIVKHIKNKLDVDFGQTTKDKRFALNEVECLGACDKAPVMVIGKKYYKNLTVEKVDEILEQYKNE